MDNGLIFTLIAIACFIIGFFLLCVHNAIDNYISSIVTSADIRYKKEYLLNVNKWIVLGVLDAFIAGIFIYLLNLKDLL